MRRYPEYKETGVEWIGKIPKHWTITRLKYVSNIPVTYGLNIEADRYTTEGIRFIRITDIDESGGLRQKGVYLAENSVPQEQILNSYDLLLSRSGATVGKSYLHLDDGKYASAGYLIRFNFGDYWTSKFIYYVTLSHFYRDWLEQQIIISTIQNVNGEKYSNFQLPIPSYQEQTQIADFLDRKTGQIDELIRIKERRIELLQEQRTVLINQAVTKGLDSTVEMKPSGMEWIGEIPKDPAVTRLKYICELIVDCEHKTAPTQETGYPLIRTPNIGIGHLMLDGVNRVSEAIYQEWSRRTIPQSGDLILAREAPVGNVAIIPKDSKVCLGQRTVLIRPDKNEVCSMFLVYLMLGDEIQAKLLGRSTGAIVHHLNMTDIRNLELPRLPSLSTQRKIADFLDHKTQQIDELISAEGQKIELLKEYRQSLISEVVTGKIDVRSEV